MAKTKEIPKGLLLDGAFTAETPDSSGEIVELEGADISDLEEGKGILNYEHLGAKKDEKSPQPSANDNIGRIVSAHKIFKESDCINDRERKYWKILKIPYLYGVVELFDADGHEGAKAAAAMIRHYADRNLPLLNRFSVEGATLDQVGSKIKKCIIRKVALTIRPCNKAATAEVLEDPKDVEIKKIHDPLDVDDTTKSEKLEHPSYTRLGGSVELEYNPILKAEDFDIVKAKSYIKLQFLKKAITAGSYNAALSSLTGGSALQVEDRNLHRARLKNQVLAAVRDYRKSDGDLKSFLKHRLPEADPDFIDMFANLVDEYTIKKAEQDLTTLHKKEEDFKLEAVNRIEALTIQLRMATKLLRKDETTQTEQAPEVPQYKIWNKKVYKTGKAIGTGKFNKDHNLTLIAPGEHGSGHKHVAISPAYKYPAFLYDPHDESYGYKILSEPELATGQFKIDSLIHGDSRFLLHPEQHSLINGTDLGTNPEDKYVGTGVNAGVSHWRKMANGKLAFIKKSGDENAATGLTDAHNEVLTYNLAKQMGLGGYFPTTSLFSHPLTGDLHSAMEQVPDGDHYSYLSTKYDQILNDLDKNGEIQKLHLFDNIIGNNDRHPGNYMFSSDPYFPIKMIDHGYALNDPSRRIYSDVHSGKDVGVDPIHPEASKWLLGQNKEQYEKTLVDHGMDPIKAFQFAERLGRMQDFANVNPFSTFGSLMSHASAFGNDRKNEPALDVAGNPVNPNYYNQEEIKNLANELKELAV